jgi:hypothetical protein
MKASIPSTQRTADFDNQATIVAGVKNSLQSERRNSVIAMASVREIGETGRRR